MWVSGILGHGAGGSVLLVGQHYKSCHVCILSQVVPAFSLVGSLSFTSVATSNVISGWVSICDSLHSWRLYSAAPLGNKAICTMTWYPTQSHYHDTELTSPCPILLIPSAWLGSDNHKSLNHRFDSTWVRRSHPDLPKLELNAQLIWLFHLVRTLWCWLYI